MILLFCVSFARRQLDTSQTQSGMQVVFETPGDQTAQAPPAQIHAPPAEARAPAPAAPPPPSSDEPEVHLNMPELPLTSQPAPSNQPQQAQQQQAQRKPTPHPAHPVQKYVVVNNLSYGHPAPPVPFAKRALNLDLAANDQDAAAGPELKIKGDPGSDWGAALDKWVNDHKYYPDAAVEQNQQGSVEIEFTVDRAGHVSGIKMRHGSGSPFLDQAWPGIFEGAQLPPLSPDAKSDTVTVDATMHYILVP